MHPLIHQPTHSPVRFSVHSRVGGFTPGNNQQTPIQLPLPHDRQLLGLGACALAPACDGDVVTAGGPASAASSLVHASSADDTDRQRDDTTIPAATLDCSGDDGGSGGGGGDGGGDGSSGGAPAAGGTTAGSGGLRIGIVGFGNFGQFMARELIKVNERW